MNENITKLTGLWYRTLVSHHKDQDCHFSIEKVWSYGHKPVYRVTHYGYILDNISEEFESNSEAEAYLTTTLVNAIREEIAYWRRATPDDWMGESQEFIDKMKVVFAEIEKELNELTPKPM